MADKEFLLRVTPLPNGGFTATCQPVETHSDEWRTEFIPHAYETEGQGSTAVAAMLAAMANWHVQDYTETQVSQ